MVQVFFLSDEGIGLEAPVSLSTGLFIAGEKALKQADSNPIGNFTLAHEQGVTKIYLNLDAS